METYDLIIVGGGIGGSALATVMARAGRSVVLDGNQITLNEVYVHPLDALPAA